MSAGIGPAEPQLSIVIPVFNGARTVRVLVEQLSRLDIEGGIEIVLVNDGSADDSAAVCNQLVESAVVPMTFVDLARNFGEHNAVMAGLRAARGLFVITMDDDLQDAPEEAARLFRYTRNSDFDVVYTSFPVKHHSMMRNLGSKFANWTADLVLNKPKGLYLSSFRCIARPIVNEIVRYEGPFPYVDGLAFQVTSRVGTFEVEHRPRAENRSNYTLRRLIRLWINIFLNFSTLPLRLSMWLGLIMTGIAGVGIIYAFVDSVRSQSIAPGWASLMIVVLLFGGLQFMVLGLLGEYLGRLFVSMGGRPQSVVRAMRSNWSPSAADVAGRS